MKEFSYYSKVPAKDTSIIDKYRDEHKRIIDEKLMTAKERSEAYEELGKKCGALYFEVAKQHVKAQKELEKEFWQDARNELGYEEFLDEQGVMILEEKAWEMGHSASFSEVFLYLDDLCVFVRRIIKHGKVRR